MFLLYQEALVKKIGFYHIKYHIECFIFTGQDLSQAKDRSILKKVIKKGRGWGQPNEGCLIDSE